MDILMKISRAEYLDMQRALNTLKSENEALKRELEALKKKNKKEAEK